MLVKPITIVITGISASGKSTLGVRLRDGLIDAGINNVELLDGEDIRRRLAEKGHDYGYSARERKELSLKVAEMARECNRNGSVCIISAIYHLKSDREQLRRIVGRVMEVYLDCPVDVCAQRDYKGHYRKAFSGEYDNFIGVTEPYQEPDTAELVLKTSTSSIEECSAALLENSLKFIRADDERKQNETIGAEANG